MNTIDRGHDAYFQDTIHAARDEQTGERPLPKWLQDQKAQSELAENKDKYIQKDHSLNIALGITVLLILLFVALFSLWLIKSRKIKE
jgi:hypothetical protein